jgi:hypothetical protein
MRPNRFSGALPSWYQTFLSLSCRRRRPCCIAQDSFLNAGINTEAPSPTRPVDMSRTPEDRTLAVYVATRGSEEMTFLASGTPHYPRVRYSADSLGHNSLGFPYHMHCRWCILQQRSLAVWQSGNLEQDIQLTERKGVLGGVKYTVQYQ